MNVFELFAKLGLDTSDYEAGLNKALSAGSALGSGLAGAARVGLQAVGAATTAVTAMGAASVKTGAEFDKSMSQVAATMGVTVDQIGELRDFAQEMGRTTAFSATQAADALNYMALAGYSADESIGMLPNVLNLAAAGNMDLARASDMVTDTQTAFGIETERVTQMVDEMAKAASTGNTSVEQLGDAFLTVGGLAQELNGGMVTLDDGTQVAVDGIQELEIALTAMANAGVKGSEAGTHMRNMLLKLSAPTQDGITSMQMLGVQVFDTEGNMRSLADILGDLDGNMKNIVPVFEDAYEQLSQMSDDEIMQQWEENPYLMEKFGVSLLDNNQKLRDWNDILQDINDTFSEGALTQEQRIGVISDMFNTRDLASAEALLNAIGEDWDDIGASILEAEGAAGQMADTQLDNLAGDVTLFKSALEGAQIAISDVLTPSLREFVQFGTDGLSRLTAGFQEGGITGAMEVFGDILSDGLNMIIEKLPDFVDAGMKLLGALGQGLLDNLPTIIDATVKIIQKLMQGLTQALPSLIQGGIELVKGIVQGMIQAIPTLIEALVSSLPEIIDGLISITMEVLNALAEMLPTLIPQLVEAFLAALNAFLSNIDLMVETAVNLIMGLTMGLINALPILIEALPQILEAIVNAIVENLPIIIEAGIQIIGALVEAILGNIGPLIAAGIQMLVSLIGGILNAIPELLTTGAHLVIELATSVLKSLPELIEGGIQIVGAIVKGITDTIGNVIEAIIGMINAILGVVADFLDSIFEAGVDIVTNIWEGIESIGKNAAQWGKDLIDNFVGGIKDKIGKVKDTVTDIANTIKDLLGFSEPEEGPLSNFHTYAPDMIDLFTSGLEANKSKIENTFDDILSLPDVEANKNVSYNSSMTPALAGIDTTIANAISEALGGITVQVNLGTERFDDMVSTSIQRTAYRSGGR